MHAARLPLTILTGALGAGKTTLLNAALREPAMARTAVIVNEFGDVGIDQMLLQAAADDTIELSGGCLCCAVRGAFTDGLTDLLMARRGDFDRIVVETSGLADPGPILAALHAHPYLSTAVRPSGVVCAVDGSADQPVDPTSPEYASQIALADRLVLTKTDVRAATDGLLRKLSALTPAAEILDAAAADFEVVTAFAPVLYARQFAASPVSAHRGAAAPFAVSLTWDRPIAMARLDEFLSQLIGVHGATILRLKGLVWTEENQARPLVLQAVGPVVAPFERLGDWPSDLRQTRLVVICRGVEADEITRLFASFTDGLAADLPDADALTRNPLAVPGVRF